MASVKEIEEKAEALLEPIAEENGVWIYDVEYVKEGSDYYLRGYIDKEGGVDINDCENVSRKFSDKLDEEDFIEGGYILEISSPGLGRQLKKDRHLQNSIGMSVDVKLYEALDGSKEYTGILESYDKENININVDGNVMGFARKTIANIRLSLDI